MASISTRHVARQAGDLHGGAGRVRRGEVGRVDLVHGREVGHVDQEDGGLDDVREVGAGGGRAGRACSRAPAIVWSRMSPSTMAPVAVQRNLPREEQELAGAERRRIRADGRGAVRRGHRLTPAVAVGHRSGGLDDLVRADAAGADADALGGAVHDRPDASAGSARTGAGPTLWAWDTVRPTTGPLSQISHRLAIPGYLDAVAARNGKPQD